MLQDMVAWRRARILSAQLSCGLWRVAYLTSATSEASWNQTTRTRSSSPQQETTRNCRTGDSWRLTSSQVSTACDQCQKLSCAHGRVSVERSWAHSWSFQIVFDEGVKRSRPLRWERQAVGSTRKYDLSVERKRHREGCGVCVAWSGPRVLTWLSNLSPP